MENNAVISEEVISFMLDFMSKCKIEKLNRSYATYRIINKHGEEVHFTTTSFCGKSFRRKMEAISYMDLPPMSNDECTYLMKHLISIVCTPAR